MAENGYTNCPKSRKMAKKWRKWLKKLKTAKTDMKTQRKHSENI
jgi:hypothetical protein